MSPEKSFWPLSVWLIITSVSLGLGLYMQSVPTAIYVLFIMATILVFVLINILHNRLPSNIIDGIAKLTKQLKGFETGKLENVGPMQNAQM